MAVRTSHVEWIGDFKTGQGTITPGSGAFEASYTYGSIFGGAPGTNPIEVLAASLAGCFCGALAACLTRDNYVPGRIAADAEAHVNPPGDGYGIARILLHARAEVPGIDAAAFAEYADRAVRTCPVGQALSAVEITLDAELV